MLKIFKYGIAVIYLVMGLFLLIKGWYMLSPRLNLGLGILILAYGIFRVYRVYREHPGDNIKDDEFPVK